MPVRPPGGAPRFDWDWDLPVCFRTGGFATCFGMPPAMGTGPPEGTSSTGRASVSKTEGWGFKSLVPCEETLHSNPDEKVENVADGNAVQDRRDSRGDDRGRTSPATFLRQVVAELRKVVWPTQQQLITYFFVVLVFVVAVMALVTVLDLAFGKLVFEIFAGGTSTQ